MRCASAGGSLVVTGPGVQLRAQRSGVDFDAVRVLDAVVELGG